MELLNKITGRWITQTTVRDAKGQHAFKPLGSDIYQWSPDGNFIVHTAYGIRDSVGFGAMEIIGYDRETGHFISYNFNPDGSFNMDKLVIQNDTWLWTGKKIRSTGHMSKQRTHFTVTHETITDNAKYTYFMESRLTKGAEF